MVGWYGPFQLARTGYEVFVSTIFGKHADKRILHAIADNGGLRERFYYEIKDQKAEDFWFDYVSDVGDGFDSTYSVAYQVTRPDLPLRTGEKGLVEYPTKRGELLIFGGDEVYPTAGRAAYDERLVDPYAAAFPKKTPKQLEKEPGVKIPAVFAIPGNHDWYDSLVIFMNLFGRGKKFCGWQSYQNRSYFALKLPRGWWLFGTDMQLASSLDDAQVDYFETIVRDHMKEGDRIVLCNAEPHWITRTMYPTDPAYNNRNMGFFEGHILNKRVAIHIAGDRHYYKRHEETSEHKKSVDPDSKSKIQKIVAGGGGAFLHPTHREGVETVGIDHLYKLKTTYPSESTSFWLTFWNLLFPLWNLKFGLVTGVLYVLTAQAFTADLSKFVLADYKSAIAAVLTDVAYEPLATFWIALIIGAFLLFTDTHSRFFRWTMGPVHALVHLSAVFLLGWAAAYLFSEFSTLPSVLLSIALVFTGGYIVGSKIMGLYLFLSLNLFGVHHNEAFSALSIADYKNFLRFRIDKAGDLTIFPVGIERVTRKWRDGERSKGEPKVVPDVDPLETKYKPFLIEEPIYYVKPPVVAAPAEQPSVDPTTLESFEKRPLKI